MIKQQVSNYEALFEFSSSKLQPIGDSASPKEMIFHILPDNKQNVTVLDIGFGAGALGKLIKSNHSTCHWQVDGVDGWEPNCQNLELINQRIYRNIWLGLAQEISSIQLSAYNIICLLDVIEHLDIPTSKNLLKFLLTQLHPESYLFISTPLWFYPQNSAQDGDLEEHLIGVPASSMISLLPIMYCMNHPLIGGFVLSKASLDYIDFFQPTCNKNFSMEMGINILNAMNIEYRPGVLFKK